MNPNLNQSIIWKRSKHGKKIIEVKDEVDLKPVEEPVESNPFSYQEKFVNGVDFYARGNEPNWTLEIDLEKSMSFTTMDDIKLSTPAVEGIKAQDSDVTLFRAKTEKGELIVTVIKDNCEDNMSGEKFSYKVRVEAKILLMKITKHLMAVESSYQICDYMISG